MGTGLGSGQPQRQLPILARVAVDEGFQARRHVTPFQPKPTQDFLRDGLRDIRGPIGLRVEHDHAQRIAVLAGHQVGDGGVVVGAVDIGLGERRTKPAIVVDDDVEICRYSRNKRGLIRNNSL